MKTNRKFMLVTDGNTTNVLSSHELAVVPAHNDSVTRVTTVDVADLPEDAIDALMALMEGELADEATIVWSDLAVDQYTDLEGEGVA